MATTKISALGGVTAVAASNEFMLNESGDSKKATAAQVGTFFFTEIDGSTGSAGEYITKQRLTSDGADNNTTTLNSVMWTSALASGVYHFRYDIVYRTSATNTGVDFGLGFTGTLSWVVATSFFPEAGTGTAGNSAVQATSATATMAGGKALRALETKIGTTTGCDSATADMHMGIEGILQVTATGDLKLYHCSEAATNTQVRTGTTLILTKMGN